MEAVTNTVVDLDSRSPENCVDFVLLTSFADLNFVPYTCRLFVQLRGMNSGV